MKNFILLLFIVLSGITGHAQSAFNQPVDANDCTNIFFKALLEKDNKTLNNLLAYDFSVTGMDGQMITRDLLMEAVSQGYLRIDSGTTSGMRTRDYGNVGVVTGTWSARGQLQNYSFQNDLAYMAVCVKSGGTWKISAVQLTPVK